LAALGMLTKGPQAPVYFLGGVGLFLLVAGRLRAAFRWPQWVGLAMFLALWAAWQVPYLERVGSQNAWRMFSGDITMRFAGVNGPRLWRHMLTYPWEVAACMLPWSCCCLTCGVIFAAAWAKLAAT
jgi:4-amino-4-deoxy-L-arabinose transferase-like glycosyltransferase